ncbi:MAG: gfo/Idh/MocA family oxidoreductase [Bacteroidetes bacterium]|nr:MAG: gfo/Idh/MocA family oxidoreductase [Bacteroidota bacterium]
MSSKIRMGMVGGGIDAFIGAVHRIAANIDGQIELVCGAFSSNPEKTKATADALFLNPNRAYPTFQDMILKEKLLPENERMQVVSIVTPNHLHFEPAKMALENGFHVICDKPVTFSLAEAIELEKIVTKTGLVFALTHTYTGYPMLKEAKYLIKTGKLGKIRKVVVEYPQGWLSTNLETSGQKQADWRTDPKRAGISCCMGDIGTHAENLAEFVTGLHITEVCADLSTFVEGRLLDDDGNVLIRFENGAKGVLHASQISAGEENNINIRVYGEKGGLQWQQKDNNSLTIMLLDNPVEILRTGGPGLSSKAAPANTRVPAGHPEGYLEAFANIYRNFAFAVRAYNNGIKHDFDTFDFPQIDAGIRGMLFVEKVVESSKKNAWVKM